MILFTLMIHYTCLLEKPCQKYQLKHTVHKNFRSARIFTYLVIREANVLLLYDLYASFKEGGVLKAGIGLKLPGSYAGFKDWHYIEYYIN